MPCVSAVFTEQPWKKRSQTVFRKCCLSLNSSMVSAASQSGGFRKASTHPTRLEKLGPAEALAYQRGDHLFHFGSDDVAVREFIVVEDAAEQPFGEQVLDEHLVHGVAADVRVQGRLA